ncbi:MAG: hypothetical protein ABI054_01000 [Planctomycetota bacterium]
MSLAFLFAALAQVAVAQTPEPRSVIDLAMEAHLAVARSERELEFFDRYEKAGPEARARARAVLERLRSPGSPSGAPSSSFAVAKATRALEPAPLASDEAARLANERLQELVDALDLQPTPGMFNAGAPIEGRLVRVAVYPLYAPAERLQTTLSLWWTRPDGKSQLGYRGLAKSDVFDTQGFSVEIAAPGSEIGTWKLAVEVERENLVARGAAIEIQSVPRLADRSRALFDVLEAPDDPRQPLARWIALASQRGMRTLAGLALDDQLARLEAAPRQGVPYPWCMAFMGEDSDPQWLWRVEGPGAPKASLLILCPSTEPPEAALSRSAWAWPGFRVLSTHLPRGAGQEGSVKELFDRIHAALAREGLDDQPLVCVARGDSIGRLAMGFYGAKARPYSADVVALSSPPRQSREPGRAGTAHRFRSRGPRGDLRADRRIEDLVAGRAADSADR